MNKTKIADHMNSVKKSAIREIFDSSPVDAVNLGLGEIQFPLPDFLKQIAAEIVSSKKIGYSTNAGLIELRKAICDYYQHEFNDNVCVTAGAEEALFATLFSYLNKGDEVLIADPTFLAYKTIVEMLGAKAASFSLDPQNEFAVNEKSLRTAATAKTKAIILCNPSNPLGITLKDHEIDLIVDICRENNILLIVDEVYRELFLNELPRSFMNTDLDAIIISSLSKSHCMSGWRIGWAISKQQELIAPIIKAHQYICTCAPTVSQQLAIEALSTEGIKAKEEIRLQLLENRIIAIDYLNSNTIEYLPNTSSPYLFIKINSYDWNVAKELSQNGVVVIPGSAFGSNGKGFIRINYGIEQYQLLLGLKIFSNYLKDK
jgi:aspartate aminotransferase